MDSNSKKSMKGQYFSFDAVVASVIFILAMSMLLGQWYAISQATDMTSQFMLDDAMRISDVLLSPPKPDMWYARPNMQSLSNVDKVGLSQNTGPGVYLNSTTVRAIDISNSNAWYSRQYYNSFRTMLGAGAQIYGVVYYKDGAADRFVFFGNTWNATPASDVSGRVQVQRVIAINETGTGRTVPGAMFLVLYTNK